MNVENVGSILKNGVCGSNPCVYGINLLPYDLYSYSADHKEESDRSRVWPLSAVTIRSEVIQIAHVRKKNIATLTITV